MEYEGTVAKFIQRLHFADMVPSQRRVLREGLVAGLIGAGSVASWFLVGVQPALHRGLDQRPLDDAEDDNVAGESREAGAGTGTDDESVSTEH